MSSAIFTSIIDDLKEDLIDSNNWTSGIQKALDLVRKASVWVANIEKMTNAEKQAFCVEWALRAYDAFAAGATAHFAAWWLVPVFAIARPIVAGALPGIVDWIYQQTVKPTLPETPTA